MTAVTDFRTEPQTVQSLEKLGYKVVKTPKIPVLYNAVCGHADMMLCKISDTEAVAAPLVYEYFKSNLPDCTVYCGKTELESKYPYDIAYNAAIVGKYIICNEKYTDEVILNLCREKGIAVIDVKQGYAKCSVCPVSDNALITSDVNIARNVRKFGIDVLQIDNSCIALEDFDCGFIGGASGTEKNGFIMFNGDIKLHQDCKIVENFCKERMVKTISLNNGALTDIGSIVFVGR